MSTEREDMGHDNTSELRPPEWRLLWWSQSAELADALVQHEWSLCTRGLVVEGKAADDIQLCPMCQTPLPGLGEPYARVYHCMQRVQQMNAALGTPVQEPLIFKDCSHSAKCDAARKIVGSWCMWYGPWACVCMFLERGWWEYEARTVCDGGMNYWQGCTCT